MEYIPTESIEFITTEEYPKEDVQRCQQKSKEMMKVIIDIFDRYGIDYMVAHGTLLGLIRHHGFIPWDDDCDLFVFDEHYARAIELLRRELPNDMVVHNRRTDPIYWPIWTKIRDVYSDTEESLWKIDQKFRFHGIAIDLLRVKTFRNGKFKVRKRWAKLRSDVKRSKKVLLSSEKFLRKCKHFLLMVWNCCRYIGLQVIRQIDRRKILCANYNTVIETVFWYKDVFPLRKNEFDFDGIPVTAPKNTDKVLRSLYGDYMELPPLEKRLPHFSKVTFFDSKIGMAESGKAE